jgi:hypothetical protein
MKRKRFYKFSGWEIGSKAWPVKRKILKTSTFLKTCCCRAANCSRKQLRVLLYSFWEPAASRLFLKILNLKKAILNNPAICKK